MMPGDAGRSATATTTTTTAAAAAASDAGAVPASTFSGGPAVTDEGQPPPPLPLSASTSGAGSNSGRTASDGERGGREGDGAARMMMARGVTMTVRKAPQLSSHLYCGFESCSM